MEDYTLVVDVDGTICPIKNNDERYEDLVPFPQMIKRITEYKRQGIKIILYTSRNMNSYQGDMDKILRFTKPTLEKWLQKWQIPYDELIFGKPWPGHKGFYVDDRTVRPDEFLSSSLEELEERCSKSRYKLEV